MRRHKVIWLLSLCLTILNIFDVYAQVDSERVYEIESLNTYINNYYGIHFENINGNIYNIDKDGNVVYGYSYDNQGNIYYTEEGSAGPSDMGTGVIREKEGPNGVYFDAEGHLVNPSSSSFYYDYAKKFEEIGYIEFKSLDEANGFLEFYMFQYSLTNLKVDRYRLEKVIVYDNRNNVELDYVYRLSLLDNSVKRQDVVDMILAKYGTLDGATIQEKLYSACEKIVNSMTYNRLYEPALLSQAVEDNQGVCWQYAKIAKVLLEADGINSEVMLGYFNGNKEEAHAWLKVYSYDDDVVRFQNHDEVSISGEELQVTTVVDSVGGAEGENGGLRDSRAESWTEPAGILLNTSDINTAFNELEEQLDYTGSYISNEWLSDVYMYTKDNIMSTKDSIELVINALNISVLSNSGAGVYTEVSIDESIGEEALIGEDVVADRVFLKYYYMDPTTVQSMEDYKYSNISYIEYCKRYEVSRYIDG